MSTFMEPGRIFALLFAIAALSLASCSGKENASDGHDTGHTVHWGYDPGNGPADWGSMNPEWILCAEGLEQSPIDLANVTEIELPGAEIDTLSEQEVEVLNQEGVI